MPGIVILDATAHSNLLYALLEGTVYVVPVPGAFVTMATSPCMWPERSRGWQDQNEGHGRTRLPRLAAELAKEIGPGRKVFLCVHKLAKDLAATYSTEALPLRVGWWGAVDGSNDWADCDVAVIFGLPYMDPRRAINNVFAVSGPQDNTWLQSPPVYERNANILDVMMQRDVSASVVQAINRIHCRRVIDTEGRCEKSDVYIVLPKGWRGDAISEDICTNMPGIRVVPWDFEPDGPRVYAARSGSAVDAVVGLMRDRKPVGVFVHIQRELDLSPKQMKRLKDSYPRQRVSSRAP